MITDAQTAEAQEIRVTSSASPDDIIRYLLYDPEQGLLEGSREQWYDCIDQGGRTYMPSQAEKRAQTSNRTAITTIQLNVAEIGAVQQSFLPIDVVFSIDASGSMRQNDPDEYRLSAVKNFTDKLNPSIDQAALVSWSNTLVSSAPLSSNFASIKEEIDNVGSAGQTDINVALREAISILDNNTRSERSSKVIILITDGEADSPLQIYSLAQEAITKGYRIYPIGLAMDEGGEEEENLIKMATLTNGQYYSSPTAANLQAAFDTITVESSNEPANVNVTEVTHNYIGIDEKNFFSIKPTSIQRNQDNQTIIRWENISQDVGNEDSKLSADEIFSMNFSANVFSNMEKLNNTLPVRIEGESKVKYTDPNGNAQAIAIPQTYVKLLTSQICEVPRDPVLRALEIATVALTNATTALTNTTKALQDILLKLMEERKM